MKNDTDPVEVVWWAMIGLVAGGVLALCSGCSAAGDGPLEQQILPCDETFTPDGLLTPYVETSALRWGLAMGINICVQEKGIPVELVSELVTDKGEESCGDTPIFEDKWGQFLYTDRVHVSALHMGDPDHCPSILNTVMHEMGHALSHMNAHDKWHADSGLMGATASADEYVDLPALNLICKRAKCR